MTSASNIISLMTPSRPSRLPVRRRLNFGQDNDENRPVRPESTENFLKRSISEAMESDERRFAELYNFNTRTGRPVDNLRSSEQNFDWSKSRDAPAVYRAVLLRNRRAEALNSIGTKQVKALPFGTLSPATQTPTKRAPTKRSRAQLDFSKPAAPVSAPVEAKKAKIATKLTMRPKNQKETTTNLQ